MYSNKNIGRTVSSSASFEEDIDGFSGKKQEATKKHNLIKGEPQLKTTTADNKTQYGLSTKVALGKLHDEIEKMLRGYELKWKEER